MAYNSCKIFKTEFVLLGIGNFQIRVRAAAWDVVFEGRGCMGRILSEVPQR